MEVVKEHRRLVIGSLLILVVVCSLLYYTWAAARWRRSLIVATTTSLYDTGLLDVIEDHYEKKYNVKIYFISVGSGLALKHAERGDADAVLVHDPSQEVAFLEEKACVVRKIIAYNFFAIVGPVEDPAATKGLSPTESLQRIVEAGRAGTATWVSRGDNSGTHSKEKALWSAAGYDYTELGKESWYVESGTGMGKTLTLANEKKAYTLADIGTYVKYYNQGLIQLEPLITRGKELLNVYSVMAVNPEARPDVDFEGAIQLINFLASDEGQGIIEQYKTGETTLFYPAVKLLKENTDPTLADWIREYAFINGTECPPEYRAGQNELYV